MLAARVADDDVQAAELLYCLRHQPLAKGLFPQVPRDRHAVSTGFLDQLDDFARIGLLAREVVDRYIGALAGVRNGRGPSHPRVAAGDERLAPSEPSRAAVRLLAMIGLRVHVVREPRPWLGLLLEWRLRVFRPRIIHGRLTCGGGSSRWRRAGRAGAGSRGRDSCTDPSHNLAPRDGVSIKGVHTSLLAKGVPRCPSLSVVPAGWRCVFGLNREDCVSCSARAMPCFASANNVAHNDPLGRATDRLLL